MRCTSVNDKGNSYRTARQGNVIKRLLLLFTMTICLAFVGGQSTPGTQAGVPCDLVCGDPFIDPNDGQCYVMCCPVDPECGRRCEMKPCKSGS